MTKSLLSKAVLAGRLYAGSTACGIKVAQRLYNRYSKACQAVANQTGVDFAEVMDQVGREAGRQGAIVPTPGKDF